MGQELRLYNFREGDDHAGAFRSWWGRGLYGPSSPHTRSLLLSLRLTAWLPSWAWLQLLYMGYMNSSGDCLESRFRGRPGQGEVKRQVPGQGSGLKVNLCTC